MIREPRGEPKGVFMAGVINYEQDVTGENPSNLVSREPQVISTINPITQDILVPNFPPFFPNNFLLETQDSNGVFSPLELGVDYDFVLPWYSFKEETGKYVYGGVKVLRKPTGPMVFVTYQTLGGHHTADKNMLLMALADYVWNPRIVQFDQLTNVQETFPPNQHQDNLEQFRKWEGVQEALNQMTLKIGEVDSPTLLLQQELLRVLTAYDLLVAKTDDLASELILIKERLSLIENR